MTRLALALLLLTAACTTAADPLPVNTAPVADAVSPTADWPVTTRLHVDLWLHGFALVQEDSTLVPYFERGYRTRMLAVKQQANAMTTLDAERDRLRAGLTSNPRLLSAQFLALQFSSWDAMRRAIDLFLAADGDPRQATSQQEYAILGAFAAYFPSATERDWLRVFSNALRDEHDRYFAGWWRQRQTERAPVLARVDSLWQNGTYPKLRGFFRGTRGAQGTIYLSLPLDGEGRTLTGATRAENLIAVSFPATADVASEAIYVIVHELAGRVVSIAVNDNTSPAEQRSGVSDRYTAAGLVRGGAMLLQRIQSPLYEGYLRYYLRAANAAVPANGAAQLEQAFARTFPLPQPIIDAIARQLDVVLGGI
jgi:hypothetical protein